MVQSILTQREGGESVLQQIEERVLLPSARASTTVVTLGSHRSGRSRDLPSVLSAVRIAQS